MDVDVLLTDIKFVGPLSFVETLRDLIPLDGFSDPPYLDITPQGIDAGFSWRCRTSRSAFQPDQPEPGRGLHRALHRPAAVSVRFNFCTREQPFNLTVTLFGGGGFFGVTIDPHGVQILEASFEFGASISIDLGVASGGVHVMAGIYFRMEQDAASLTGYFRLGGNVDVLGIITRLARAVSRAALRVRERQVRRQGRAHDRDLGLHLLRQRHHQLRAQVRRLQRRSRASARLMGPARAAARQRTGGLIDANTDYAWREYCEAFA